MKTTQKALTKTELLELSKTDKTILRHILSPLELSAWDNKYKAFIYKMEGIPFTVSVKDSMGIMAISKAKMDTFSLLIYKTQANLKVSKAAQFFLESDITKHQLPNYLLNQICYHHQCKTPCDVLRLGKQKLKTSKGMRV